MPTNDKWYGMNWITKERRLAIYLRDKFQCLYCGTDLHCCRKGEIALDHLVCRSKGGNNTSPNLVTVCKRCNSQRGDRDWTDYATGGAQARIRKAVQKDVPLALAKAILAGTAADPRSEARR